LIVAANGQDLLDFPSAETPKETCLMSINRSKRIPQAAKVDSMILAALQAHGTMTMDQLIVCRRN
jgi:hypothetical protein